MYFVCDLLGCVAPPSDEHVCVAGGPAGVVSPRQPPTGLSFESPGSYDPAWPAGTVSSLAARLEPCVPGDGMFIGSGSGTCVLPEVLVTGPEGERKAGAPHSAGSHANETKEMVSCGRQLENVRKAKKIVKLLAVDRSLKARRVAGGRPATLPKHIVCGSLRDVVRQMYAPGLSPVQELSIKTTAKAEGSPCQFCSVGQTERLMAFEKARLRSQVVDFDHLSRFSAAFARNVPVGWNKRKEPYIPNGHATMSSSRRQGGNWRSEPFSRDCSMKLVWSSGKPRVVTLYSSFNVETLTPLHNSLYGFLKGMGWLLVGSPTDERLRYLASGCSGTLWHSFDYESATDNIKTMYVQRMVDIIIDKGEGLSSDEVDCLRVLSELRLGGAVAESGQPMGSPMSFPLLCLINKTVFDMALTDLLIEGEIDFNEWSRHRCLINGDDLLTRSTSSGDLVGAVARNGAEAGLVVNKEKTMTDPNWAEINSTAFFGSGEEVTVRKKTNVSALWMGADVQDVIGFACEATTSGRGLSRVVRANVTRLARQKIKTFSPCSPVVLSSLLRDRRIREALVSVPCTDVPEPPNPFDMVDEPGSYHVTREEVFEVVTSEVARVRDSRRWAEVPVLLRQLKRDRRAVKVRQVGRADRKTAKAILQTKRPPARNRIMRVLADRWQWNTKEKLLAEDNGSNTHVYSDTVVFDGESCSVFTQMSYWINNHKRKNARSSKTCRFGDCPDPFSEGVGEVRFCE
jgi:hypothetical protein